ncbi:hypothetical protein DPMN_124058 [Dreissena polymorpha]|uniref:Uncharacterized protein n=1 Tax=Dreissena polymorpha TaxID=45954 RepID=A0A9D4GVQ1_DREPO|nr:hypothetical protein DPMN_124058 [Dreissena polymorpha]
MPHAVESFLQVNAVVEEVMLVLQVLFNDDSAVEDPFHCAPPSSESSLLLSQQLLGITIQSIKDDA